MSTSTRETIDLSGSWRLALDPDQRGEAGRWFAEGGAALAERCTLPGSIQQQGFGDDVTAETAWTADRNGSTRFDTDPKYAPYRVPGNVKFPYWLQPSKYYAGVAWFAREVTIGASWAGRQIVLHLERCHWQTSVWVDGVAVGGPCDSLSTPHEHDLTAHLAPGVHTITLRVDNRILHDVGPNAHSVSDHTQGNWNGVVGAIALRASSPVRLGTTSVRADLAAKRLRFSVRVESAAPGRGRLRCRGVTTSIAWDAAGGRAELDVPIDGLPLWSEHAPALIDSEIALEGDDGREFDRRSLRHGIRELATDGTRILVNGIPTLLRGTLECCIFPLTGHPPTAVGPWRRIMTIAKRHGLNHLRFHSWCPPEAAFVAADEVGLYLQVECAAWPNQGATLGGGRSLDAWLYAEAHRIVDAYGHHPSFVMLACGNEPAGERHVKFLDEWLAHWRANDPQRLHSGGAGWPVNEGSDFHIRFQPRIQQWGAGLTSRINARDVDTTLDYRDQIEALPKPTVTHEIGQWCVYPDLAAIGKYDGLLRATSFEIALDSLRANGLAHLAPAFLLASGALQTLTYKEEIESQLRTPGLGGFQLLDLHDFPGQGTALVGMLDAFWDSKGYVTPEAFRRFCGPTVLLARIAKRVFSSAETFDADIELSYFEAEARSGCSVHWRLERADGVALAGGTFANVSLRPGDLRAIGRVSVALDRVSAPAALRLVVDAPGVAPANDWNLWVYPPSADVGGDVLIATQIDDAFVAAASAGRPILFCPHPAAIASPVALGFSPIFWNTLFTNGQAPHTLGLLVDADHAALGRFPTSTHSDWQWQEPIRHAACLMLDGLGGRRPERLIVRVIDDWNENRSLALLFECQVGHSRVVVSGIDLDGDLSNRPASRQLRDSLLRDLAGAADLRERLTLSIDDLRRLLSNGPDEPGVARADRRSTYGG